MDSKRHDEQPPPSEPAPYEPPRVEDLPATEGPMVVAAGTDGSPPRVSAA